LADPVVKVTAVSLAKTAELIEILLGTDSGESKEPDGMYG